ncbi:GntP family gluconate:H+ symporter [Halopolyspora algeriensis]|uniref:GntP family gluconate:H+ symporter n=1 Tax=Halopolyspora algeriensis TaxID=1500506 RepID=A0A368VNS7_9ACTN|nr:GntP family permease [Halopolyspora algeriensis]RCW43144.1 GntP family gluconate:H+ symporter [Halopolyspora algeriensis]TQM56202.1 GntP family gluconate:H+ symporter [Halopolyspora algeriensis]
METMQPAYGVVPLLLIAVAAVALLLLLIMRFKLHAFISLVLVSLLVALATQVPLDEIVDTLLAGFGETLASVGLLVGLGAMIGRLLEITGGAQVLANTLINRFGRGRAPLALGVASLIFGFPIFFDAGFVVFLPIIFSVARRFGGSLLLYALPVAGGFAAMHAFVPPHPGPVAAATLLGANVGLVLLVGLLVAIPSWYLGAYLFSQFIGRRLDVPLPSNMPGASSTSGDGGTEDEGQEPPVQLPRFSTVITILLVPLFLIFLNTGLDTLGSTGVVNPDQTWVQALQMIGQTPIALLATAILSIVVLGRGRSNASVEQIVNGALGPVCSIILITGAGGMFGAVLNKSGIGTALADTLAAAGFPLIVAAFVISTALRVAQGSATVALTTTAGLLAPTVAATEGLSPLYRVLLVLAIACGATVLSHVNDSGFWLVTRFLDMDVKTGLKTWTVLETLLGGIAFLLVLLISLVA